MANKIKQFVLDLETAGLPFRSMGAKHSLSGEYSIPPMDVVMRNNSHLDIYQFGLFDPKTGKTKHISVEPGQNLAKGKVVGKEITGFEFVNGIRIPVKKYIVETTTKEDILDTLTKSGKLSRSQITGYVKSVGEILEKTSRVINIEAELNGRTVNASKWGFMNMMNSGEFRIGNTNTPLQNKLMNNPLIDYRGIVPSDSFIGEKTENTLFSEISAIVNGKKSEILGWNIGYDIDIVRAVLQRGGHTELLQKFNLAVSDGTIKLKGVEREWQRLVYRLVKENPEMRSSFKIRWTPNAFAETGGRSGRTIQSFHEFMYSTNVISQQHVAKVLGFTKEIKAAMPSGLEEHAASLDVNLTKATKNVMDRLLKIVNLDRKEKKLPLIKSIEELSRLKDKDKMLTRAFDKLLKENKSSSEVGDILELIKNPAEKIAGLESERFGRSFTSALNKIEHSSSLLKYGVPALLGAATLLATYGTGGDERSSTFLNKIPGLSDAMSFLKSRQVRHGKVNDTAVERTHLMKTLATMVAVPLASLWAVGYVNAKQAYKPFGIGAKRINTVGDAIDQFFRTALYGAKKVEAVFPIMKIARLSDMSDYIFGDKAYGQLENGLWRGKKFKTIDIAKRGVNEGKARIVGRFEHGVSFESLLSAAAETKNENLAALKDLLVPQKVPDGVGKRIPMISVDKQGRAIVFGEEFTLDGKKITDGKYSSIWEKGITIDARISINELRHREPFGKGRVALRDLSSNALSYLDMQKRLIENGYTSKASLEEVMKMAGVPFHEGGYAYWEGMVRHALDIGAKGVGESKNIFYKNASELMQKSTTMINVKSLTGIKKWSYDNAVRMTRFLSPIIQNFTIEGMNNFLERPFEFLVLDNKKVWSFAKKLKESNNIAGKIAGKALSFIAAPHLGLPMYDISGGMAGYLGEFALKRILPAAAAIEAFRFADHALGAILQSPTGRGPLTTLPIKAYEGLSLLYSKISDLTGMTALSKKQESIAPGSTSFGLFSTAASFSSTGYLAAKMFKVMPENMQKSISDVAVNILKRNNMESVLLRGTSGAVFAERTPVRKFLSWAISNPKKALFAAGLIPAIPFLPGFLGSSKTYAERKAEFQGKKEVAIRKNRGWILSTSPFEGGRVSHFRQHAASLIEKDWENRGVIWPSYWKRLAHNLTGGLYGRYMLEEYHAKDQPVYQSAPYGASIPIIGPLISSTIGRFVKPTIDYHKFGLEYQGDGVGAVVLQNISGSNSKTLKAFGTGAAFSKNAINGSKITIDELAHKIGLVEEGSLYSMENKFARGFHDFIGFRGFGYEAMKAAVTGRKTPDEFTPYAQSATEFYNTSQQMWAYQEGDISLVGGEFLRRIFQYPDKRWTVNQLPNELSGVSWIPQGGSDTGKTSSKNITRGTTFDKIPMGWLYGTRKGWETLYPEVKGVELENYPDPIRVEVLKHVAPFTAEFNEAATRVGDLATTNRLTPEQEQRYYESLKQVGQLKEQLYAYEGENSYSVSTSNIQGTIQEVDDSGRFTLDNMPGRTFRLAGVSLEEEDVRAKLLKQKQFKDQFELSKAMQSVIEETKDIMQKNLYAGRRISIDIPQFDQMINPNMETEAIVGGLNTELINMGAGFVNTGNLSKYNIFQQINGFPSRMISKYWDAITSGESFWINKLKPRRDYLSHYKYSNVYNRDVKLWNHPIEQIFKPMVASTLHKFGVDTIPRFTIARRRNQEYWDILKFIKGKILENKTGDPEYREMWRSTMIGADPVNGNHQELLKALPENERVFFSRFANEPNPKKRGQILKYLPAASRRIYTTLWAKQQHEAVTGNDKDEQEFWDNIKQSEGFGMSEAEERQWRAETNGHTTRADWKRLKYIEKYSESHYIPDLNNSIWDENVDIDNVELLSLRGDGENIEDYGFFEDKARIAAYDSKANLVALQLKSQVLSMSGGVGSIAPYLASDYNAKDAQSQPSNTINPLLQSHIQTNGYERLLKKNYGRYIAEIADDIVMVALRR